MTDFSHILASHAARYPLMQPCDAVKLIFQSVFGTGHMLSSESAVAERLEGEYADASHTRPFTIEALGEFSRIYLDSLLSPAQRSMLARCFCASTVEKNARTVEKFENRLALLRQMTDAGQLPFPLTTLDDYLAAYRAAGCPAVSHSPRYRDAYHPAYRIVDTGYARLFEALVAIDTLLSQQPRAVVAIDGRCAAGKSTAAALISRIFDTEIIAIDDFFLPRALRTPERLAEIGGNFHRERFQEEVLPQLRDERFAYRRFDCATMDYRRELRRVEPSRLRLCEGSYSLHPALGDYYDLAIFLDIAKEEQRRRILCRNGEAMLSVFQARWIPMEERYFEKLAIRERADFCLT